MLPCACQINNSYCIVDRCAAWRSDNFIVGLTDVSPTVTAPTLWNYDALCGQYPGVVGVGTTVHLQCTSTTPALVVPGTPLLRHVTLPAVYLQCHGGVQIPDRAVSYY